MSIRSATQLHRDTKVRVGRLHLNGVDVGRVVSLGRDGSWTFGEFTPADAFGKFAPIFGRWSLLMHADNTGERLSPAASQELREAEYALDTLRATIILDDDGSHSIRQVSIDGPLIEWKEV